MCKHYAFDPPQTLARHTYTFRYMHATGLLKGLLFIITVALASHMATNTSLYRKTVFFFKGLNAFTR